jgi:hypothetical protein
MLPASLGFEVKNEVLKKMAPTSKATAPSTATAREELRYM